MFLGLIDPDPLVTSPDPDPFILSKNSKQNLDLLFCYFFYILSLIIDINVPSKRNKQKFFVVLKVNDENSRIRIH
jgi:hypothetical protein